MHKSRSPYRTYQEVPLKKLLSFLLVFALLLVPFAVARGEEGPEILKSGDYQYALLEDGTAEIREYTGKADSLEIPDTLDGHPVTRIGYNAFSSCSSLTSIIIPDSVTAIGDYTFFNCTSLTSITIPDSVTAIGANPFRYCKALTTITVSPDHPALAVIDGVLFSKADKRLVCYPTAFTETAYAIPQGITCVGDDAFSGCGNLTSIALPDSVTSIGDEAFSDCSSLTSITIPDSVTSIGAKAFSGCTGLTSITIPDSVTSIGDSAFNDCNEALTITVPRGSYAAQYCKKNGLSYTYPDALDWLTN